MKIASIITGLSIGGAETMLLNICEEMAARGHEQLVITLTEKQELRPLFEAAGIDVVFIDRSAGLLRTVRAIKKALKEFAPDIVHTHLPMADTLGRMAALSLKVPVFTTIHNNDEWKKSTSLFHRILRLYNRFTINQYKRVHLLFVSESSRKYNIKYEKLRPEKLKTIHNFIDFEPQKKSSGGISRAALGFADGDFVLCNVGRLAPEKAQIDLISAMGLIAAEGFDDIKCLILGQGDLKQELSEQIARLGLDNQVILTGAVSNVYDYFDVSNLFVLPSYIEGCSIALQEAILCSLPALVSDIEPNTELICEGGGLTFETGNIPSLKNAVLSARENRSRLADMADTAKSGTTIYSRETYATILLKEYQAALTDMKTV